MKMDCDVIRDLLPLYADEACSGESRTLVEEHLQGCTSCRDMLRKMKESEIEDDLRSEKDSVIAYGARRFRRRSAAVGSAVSGSVLIPILICLYINIVLGSSMLCRFWCRRTKPSGPSARSPQASCCCLQ